MFSVILVESLMCWSEEELNTATKKAHLLSSADSKFKLKSLPMEIVSKFEIFFNNSSTSEVNRLRFLW